MDVHASLAIDAPGPPDELPRFTLVEPVRDRRRARLAFAAALVVHLLVPLAALRLAVPRAAPPAVQPAAPTPPPVRVVFYETKPRPPAEPPAATRDLSDVAHRAVSEIAPPAPQPTRLPAAAGTSHERRPEREAPQAPPRAQPRAASAAREPVSAAPVAGASETPAQPQAPRLSPSLAAYGAETSGGRSSAFAATALDGAIRQHGFANPASGVGETGALDFDAKDFEWGPYARLVYERVDRNWKSVMPLAARMPGVSGRVRLSFRIHRSGRVSELTLVESSGKAALDQAALASIELSDPLPPLPREFARDDVGVTFAYYYNLPVGD